MRDLSEAMVSLALAFCGVALCYYILGEWLSALVMQSLESIRP
jgi:hypothetical protein